MGKGQERRSGFSQDKGERIFWLHPDVCKVRKAIGVYATLMCILCVCVCENHSFSFILPKQMSKSCSFSDSFLSSASLNRRMFPPLWLFPQSSSSHSASHFNQCIQLPFSSFLCAPFVHFLNFLLLFSLARVIMCCMVDRFMDLVNYMCTKGENHLMSLNLSCELGRCGSVLLRHRSVCSRWADGTGGKWGHWVERVWCWLASGFDCKRLQKAACLVSIY